MGRVKKVQDKAIIQRMAQVLASKVRLVTLLEAENSKLQYEHQLLTEMCNGFDALRQQQLQALIAPDAHNTQSTETCQPAFQVVTDDEMLLLLELQQLPPVHTAGAAYCSPQVHSTSSSSSAAWCESNSNMSFPASSGTPCPASTTVQPVAPLGNPLWLLKHLLARPPPAGAAQLTLPELQLIYIDTARELSLRLMHHEADTTGLLLQQQQLQQPGRKSHVQEIQRIMMEHWHLIAELCTTRPELVTALQLSNVETGERLSEPDRARAGWVVKRLGLTEGQKLCIVQGTTVFKRLLSPLLEELKQLQLDQGSETAACPGAAADDVSGRVRGGSCAACGSDSATTTDTAEDSAASSSGAASKSGSAAGGQQAAAKPGSQWGLGPTARLLEVQEQRSDRMKVLLHKDYFLRTWYASYAYGCLSWAQIAKLHVLMSPMYPTPFVLFTELAGQVAAAQEAAQKAKQNRPAVAERQATGDWRTAEGPGKRTSSCLATPSAQQRAALC